MWVLRTLMLGMVSPVGRDQGSTGPRSRPAPWARRGGDSIGVGGASAGFRFAPPGVAGPGGDTATRRVGGGADASTNPVVMSAAPITASRAVITAATLLPRRPPPCLRIDIRRGRGSVGRRR